MSLTIAFAAGLLVGITLSEVQFALRLRRACGKMPLP